MTSPVTVVEWARWSAFKGLSNDRTGIRQFVQRIFRQSLDDLISLIHTPLVDIFDYFVHRRMQSDLDRTLHETRNVDHAINRLEARVRVLEQSTEALWTLLKAKTGWTDEELIEQAKAAHSVHSPGRCPACGRTLLIQNGKNCQWCGQPLNDKPRIIGTDNEA